MLKSKELKQRKALKFSKCRENNKNLNSNKNNSKKY